MRSRPTVDRFTRRLLVIALVLSLLVVSCGGGVTQDPLVDIIGRVPEDLAAAGMYAQVGVARQTQLLEALGLDADRVVASAETTAPALRVLTGSGFDVVGDRLHDLGFSSSTAGAWEVFERPADLPGFVGLPAIALGLDVGSEVRGVRDVVAVGGLDQVAAVEEGAASLQVSHETVVGATAALVGNREGTTIALTAAPVDQEDDDNDVEGDVTAAGLLLLRFDAPPEQSRAVAAGVRLRTLAFESATVDQGTGDVALAPWRVGAPLASENVVTVPVDWLVDASQFLFSGLTTDLLTQVAATN